jgi:streptogramin lyase
MSARTFGELDDGVENAQSSRRGTSMARRENFQVRQREKRWRAARRLLLRVEDLESRLLLSGLTITQFPIQFTSAPQDVTIGSDGNVYCTDIQGNSIDELNLTTHAISVYPIPKSGSGQSVFALVSTASTITSVPKGNIYFVEPNSNAIGELNLTTHVITQIPIPTPNSQPAGIATGVDGNIYFAERMAGKIGELNLTTSVITETTVPGINPEPTGITALGTTTAPVLYFTLSGADMIGDITPNATTEPAVTVPPVPAGETLYTPSGTVYPSGTVFAPMMMLPPNTITEFTQLPYEPLAITAGTDGNLYYTESGQSGIGELIPGGAPAPTYFPPNEMITDPSTHTTYSAMSPPLLGYTFSKGSFAQFALESPAAMPDEITGFDNSLYFTDTATDEVGELTPATGLNSEVQVPSIASLGGGITSAPDGNLYFTTTISDGVGEIDTLPPTMGPITQFEVAPNIEPTGITSTPAGAGADIYFTEYSTDEIGELSPTAGSPSPPSSNFAIPTPSSGPDGIAVGADGNVYFTESLTGKIGELNTATDSVTEFPIPTLNTGISPAGISPLQIVAGPAGTSSLYFTEAGTGEIGEISSQATILQTPETVPATQTITLPDGNTYEPSSIISAGTLLPIGTITQYIVPTANSEPFGIALGAAGNIYFTESAGDKIGEISTRSESGPLSVPTGVAITIPCGMTYLAGSTALAGQNLPAGTITEFTIPTGNGPGPIAVGPGGYVWFALNDGGALAYLNPVTGVITPDYALQSFLIAGLASGPAPSEDLYLTDDVHDQIGEVSSVGQPIITFGPSTDSSQTPLDEPLGITVAASGNLWFTEYDDDEIGEAQISAQSPTTPAAQAASTLDLSASVTAAYPGESVTITAVVPPSSGLPNPTGYVTFSVNGLQQPPVALSASNQQDANAAVLSFVIVNSGTQTITAIYDGDFNYAASSPQSVVLPGDGPTVLSVQRYGVHDHPTSLVLKFSGPLVAKAAMNSANYELMSARGLPIGIAGASYDATNDTVTLHLKRKLDLHRVYELTVNGTAPSGLAGTSGLFLDGADNGSPGSDYATSITGSNLVQTKANDADPRQDRAKAHVSRVDRPRLQPR